MPAPSLTRPVRAPSRAVAGAVPPRARVAAVLALAGLAVALLLLLDLPTAWEFVLPLRAEKAATLAVVGIAIAVSTVLFQTVTGNRILTPSIMGFDALYMLIQTATVFLFGAGALSTADVHLKWLLEVTVMIAAVTLLYRWLFGGSRRSLHLLVLVGIVLGVFFRSLSTMMQRMLDPTEFAVLQDSFFASFNTVDGTLLLASSAAIAVVFAALWRIRATFDVLGLGQDIATNLGVDHRRVVMTILICIAVLVSVSTALVGPVTFFGLLVANLAYVLVGDRHALTLPTAAGLAVLALVGGQLLLERVFAFDSGLSIVIEFLGGIVFLALLLRRGAR